MKTKMITLMLACIALVTASCQGKDPTAEKRFLVSGQEALYQDLVSDFALSKFKALLMGSAVGFELFLVNGSRTPEQGAWRDMTGKLIYSDLQGENKKRGFGLELSTSMFPVLFYRVDLSSEGLRVKYWSQDFISSNEQLTQAEIDKHTVFRCYEGFLPKAQLLYVLKARLTGEWRTVAEYNFYVMKVIKEQKERPQGID